MIRGYAVFSLRFLRLFAANSSDNPDATDKKGSFPIREIRAIRGNISVHPLNPVKIQSPLAAKPAFPPNYFQSCKSAFLGGKPLLPSVYKAFIGVNNPVFGHAFCTHGAQSFFQIHALIVP
jgi:hypothetical protein